MRNEVQRKTRERKEEERREKKRKDTEKEKETRRHGERDKGRDGWESDQTSPYSAVNFLT